MSTGNPVGTGWNIRPALAVVLACALLLLSGCATYTDKLANLKPELAQGRYDEALAIVEKESGSKDRVLFYLERGLILHYADRWAESNEAFAAAERTAEELYRSSLTEGALSLITSDAGISYRGRPFELAMVPFYKAFNYIYLEDREAAQVEARRASQLLARYIDATLEGLRAEDRGELERVRNSAFLLYFSGLLYDWDGAVNDAFIAYRNAAVAFQQNHELLLVEIPPTLARDLERTGQRLGFQAELEQMRSTCPGVYAAAGLAGSGSDSPSAQEYRDAVRWQQGRGEVVLFLEAGFVAHKTQVRFDFPIFSGEAYDDPDYWAWELYYGMGNFHAMTSGQKVEYWVSVAAPELQDRPGGIGGARISAGTAAGNAVTTVVSDLSREARITFDAEKPSIFFKTILRGLTKYLASRGAEKATGQVGKWVANIFGAATERADTRSWLTLPENIHLGRLSLEPGVYDLRVDILDRQGRVLNTQSIPGVEVRAGDWTFVSRRIF
jgi:hypothetical protein